MTDKAKICILKNSINDKVYIVKSIGKNSRGKPLTLNSVLSMIKYQSTIRPSKAFTELNEIGWNNIKIELLEECNKDVTNDRLNYHLNEYKDTCMNGNKEYRSQTNDGYCRICKLVNDENDRIYICYSSCNKLLAQIIGHVKNRAQKDPNEKSYSELNSIGWNNLRIELIEQCKPEDLKGRLDYYSNMYKDISINLRKEYLEESDNEYKTLKYINCIVTLMTNITLDQLKH